MLWLDFIGQIVVGLSERFWIIRFKKFIYNQKCFSADFRDPRCSKIDLQTEFRNFFYTILDHFDPCVYLESSIFSGKVEIRGL